MELRFTVWQFVRLMVRLEQNPDARLDAWAGLWSEMDADLATLAESDPDAYGETMMDKEVVMEDTTPDQALAAKVALEAVMDELDLAIETEREAELLLSLKFERRELRQLTRKLARSGPQPETDTTEA